MTQHQNADGSDPRKVSYSWFASRAALGIAFGVILAVIGFPIGVVLVTSGHSSGWLPIILGVLGLASIGFFIPLMRAARRHGLRGVNPPLPRELGHRKTGDGRGQGGPHD